MRGGGGCRGHTWGRPLLRAGPHRSSGSLRTIEKKESVIRQRGEGERERGEGRGERGEGRGERGEGR